MEEINYDAVTKENIIGSPEESTGSEDFDMTAGFDYIDENDRELTAYEIETIQSEAQQESAEAEVTEAEVPTTEPEDRDISFTAKIDHNETPVSIKESEVATYYQKAQNMDRAVQRANEIQEKLDAANAKLNRLAAVGKATLGLEGDDPDTVLANMETGMTDTAIKSRARTYRNTDAEIAEAHVKSALKDAIDESVAKFGVVKTADVTADTSASGKAAVGERPFEEFERDVQKLISVRPDIKDKEFPSEVIGYYKSGMDIMTAYGKYESERVAAENAELKKQNAILAQNQASAKRAPVKGVSGSGSIQQADDPIYAGWDDQYW